MNQKRTARGNTMTGRKAGKGGSSRLKKFSDKELRDGLDRRMKGVNDRWLARTACGYCGLPLNTDAACEQNPFSDFHVPSPMDAQVR